MRAGAGASIIGSCHTVPVNQSAGMRRDGAEPQVLISMISPWHRGAAHDADPQVCTKSRPRPLQRPHQCSMSAARYLVSTNRSCAMRHLPNIGKVLTYNARILPDKIGARDLERAMTFHQ